MSRTAEIGQSRSLSQLRPFYLMFSTLKESAVFRWFWKRNWHRELLPALKGTEGELIIGLTNVPCLRDEITGARKYLFSDFGLEFLNAFHVAIGGAKQAQSHLLAGAAIQVLVHLPNQLPIGINMHGRPSGSVRDFESDIADALTNAFDTVQLRPR